MSPRFTDPELDALFQYLTGTATSPAAGQRPTPAHMPHRIQRPRTAADIARAEGLDLGPLTPTLRPASRPRPTRSPSPRQIVLDHLLQTGCPRPAAPDLAARWLRALSSPYLACRWIDAVGPTRHAVAAELARHGLDTDALDTRLDGTTARRRLRDGEPLGQIVARLLAR